MESSNPQNRANDAANPAESGETFVGAIRWIALTIGVACLALLALVGSVAHAAAFPLVPAPAQRHDALRTQDGTARPLTTQRTVMPAADHATISRRR